MENNERPNGGVLPEKDTKIQLVVNRPETDEVTIDLGRVFHNAKVLSRIYAWVLVFCLLVGVSAPLLLYQFNKPMTTVSSVVSLRYEAPNPEYLKAEEEKDEEALKKLDKIAPVSELVTPDGDPLDLSAVTSTPVLQQALSGLTLSAPVSIENLRNNMTVTRVLTEESSRTKEVLAGLADAKNPDVYNRLEEAELKYQSRFVVSMTNGFGESKAELKDEELKLLLNRVLDAYNNTLVKQWADIRLPEDKVSVIDPETQDLPEVLDSLDAALDDLYNYCEEQPDSVKGYRSWQTGHNLNEWMQTISTVRNTRVDYLDANVYANGLIRDKESMRLTLQYRKRTLQSDLEKLNEEIAANAVLLKNYKNDEVYVGIQESDATRTTKITTDYYNELVLKQKEAYQQASELRTQIAIIQNKIDRLNASAQAAAVTDAEETVHDAVSTVKELYANVREHMKELFTSPLFTTWSEHSAPQGEATSFLKASSKQMIIGAAVGAVIALVCWFLAALAPEFRRGRKNDAEGKEAAQA